MSFSEWLRIVPQLVSGVMGLFACALLWAAQAPSVPQTADEARAFLSAKSQTELEMEAALKIKADACYQKTLVSGCLREVDQERARLRRDLRAAEVAANELLRIEKLQAKERDRPQPGGDAPAVVRPADLSDPAHQADPVEPAATPAASGPDQPKLAPEAIVAPKAKPPRSAKPDTPSISPQEQADNRAEYDAKQRAAQARQTRQQERLEATEAKRARYREQQAAQQRQLQERAEQARRNSAETAPPLQPKQDGVR